MSVPNQFLCAARFPWHQPNYWRRIAVGMSVKSDHHAGQLQGEAHAQASACSVGAGPRCLNILCCRNTLSCPPSSRGPGGRRRSNDYALARASWLLAFPWPLPVPPARLHRRPGLCLCRGVRLASPSRCRHGKPVLVASLPLVPWLVKHNAEPEPLSLAARVKCRCSGNTEKSTSMTFRGEDLM
jgi:hypothetical protein